jgi:hypothetical protein
MTTLSLTSLLKFPLVTGASYHDKATSGLLAIQGCDFRYLGTLHNASQHRTSRSLHEGADPHGGILTPVDMCRYIHILYPFCSFFLSCASRHAVTYSVLKKRNINEDASLYYMSFGYLI